MTPILRAIVLAMTLPALLGLGPSSSAQDNDADLAVKSDVRYLANQMETFYTNHQKYPSASDVTYDGVRNVEIGRGVVVLSRGDRLGTIRLSADRESYCIRVVRARGASDTSEPWSYVSDKGGIVTGGCPARFSRVIA